MSQTTRASDRKAKRKWGTARKRFLRALAVRQSRMLGVATRARNKTQSEREATRAEWSKKAQDIALATLTPYQIACRIAKQPEATPEPVQLPLQVVGVSELVEEMRARMASLVHPDDAAQDRHVKAVLRA